MSIPKVLLTRKETPTRGCAVLAGVVTCNQAGRGERLLGGKGEPSRSAQKEDWRFSNGKERT